MTEAIQRKAVAMLSSTKNLLALGFLAISILLVRLKFYKKATLKIFVNRSAVKMMKRMLNKCKIANT